MLALVLILVDFITTRTPGFANFPVVCTHPEVWEDGKGRRLAWEREAVVTGEPTKVPTNQGSAHDGQGTGRVTWQTCAVFFELGSGFQGSGAVLKRRS